MQVTRQHRAAKARILDRRKFRIAIAGAAVLTVATGGLASAAPSGLFGDKQVGTEYRDGLLVSDNQFIKPIGERLVTENGKYMGSTVSPDGRFVAASSTDKSIVLQIVDLSTYKVVWKVGKGATADQQLADKSVGQEGPTWSPDGKFVWLPETNGLTRFPVNADGTLGTPKSFPLPKVDGNSALPGKSAYSADGKTLYVPLNGQNTVIAMDPETGAVSKTWNVGIAPRQILPVGSKLYVSNEGGRRATAGDDTMTSYGTDVPADGYKGTSTTGTVSVIDTTDASATPGSIDVGLHPTDLHLSGSTLYVANTNSDTVSVVDTTRNKVVQTIETRPWASSDVGYAPTGMTRVGDRLLVTLGGANAVAVYAVGKNPKEPARYIGLLPTDYYPAAVDSVGGKVLVTNTRGIDARGPALTFNAGPGTTPATGHGTHSTTGSFTRFTLPSDHQIAKYTKTVATQNGWAKADVKQGGKGNVKAVPVPKRVGDPSTIKHVFLLVKENRTYDQLYGDISKGNGDASLAQFGANVTPNQHALANQFGLYDNVYDIGTNSAEGHNWMMQGDNPEYTQSSAGEYVRSYDTEEDVLGHQRSGFLWTAVQDAGKTARNFGEFLYTEGKPANSTWQQYYCAAKSVEEGGDAGQLTTPELKGNYGSVIPSLNKITNPTSPPFDTSIPDQYRYQVWKQEFQKKGPAGLNMMWLSSDHTGGTADPRAQVADNDLAVGRIVDTISHSKYWKDSAIFVVEDDSQNGADHVDGHRAPVQVISPWAKHGAVVNTYYSQLNMVRTIEQILGAQPLNQKLAAATPMFDAFQQKADTKPFNAVPNQVPLTEGVATPPACGLDTLGKTGAEAKKVNAAAAKRTAVPASMKPIAAQWQKWSGNQHFTGRNARADFVSPERMNRWVWYQDTGWTKPYPGDSRIYTPRTVPGGAIPPTGDAD
ncbi:MAG TPA: alkaline phosphatase family protein [Flexivirga sp.]|uniref:bifunctional YncE family protein/alkaline phosphatase family protein n=1 Tax=Flexivirga sp. TaxID=1962927 RepID=UPI002B5672EB|nr:alkaline phosphatase family protein [Flexivirga sp.]HWC23154.1 alkaline phosphatase family protein [Flexivirga sp.]